MERINEAVAKLQPAVGLRLNVTTKTQQTATPTFREVRVLPDAERATPEHDILLGYGYSRTFPAPCPTATHRHSTTLSLRSSGPKARSSRPAAS